MLIGEYNCNTDIKGRLNFPAKLREDLGDKFIISKALNDSCLCVYSIEEWNVMATKIKSLPMSKGRNIQRHFFSSATEVEPDKQGRIVIPQGLRKYAQIEKETTIIGMSTYCEIWSSANWNDFCEATDTEDMSEEMEELGI